jgi:hypothetical protein
MTHVYKTAKSARTPIELPRPVRKSRGTDIGLPSWIRQLDQARIVVLALQIALATAAALSVYLRLESFLGNPLSSGLMTLSVASTSVAVIDRLYGRHS